MKKILLFLSLILLLAACRGPQKDEGKESAPFSSNELQILFYNVENLFDTINDPQIRDGEFTPDGSKHWTYYRYREKLNHIAKVLMNTEQWEPPAVAGFCEVENRGVLEDLISSTSLLKFNYGIVHRESPDERGIDVALIYRKDLVEIIGSRALAVRFPYDTADRTRDILLATAVVGNDTLHFFVNHWPSRYGGLEASQPDRLEAAKVLRKAVDSLLAVDPMKKIIIMGDFNDGPENKSIKEVLGTRGSPDSLDKSHPLFNFMYELKFSEGLGSHRYRGEWNTLDQFIVSKGLLEGKKWKAGTDAAEILHYPFLLTDDTRNPGSMPFRTYAGSRYLGGYSDHLPILLTLHYQKNKTR